MPYAFIIQPHTVIFGFLAGACLEFYTAQRVKFAVRGENMNRLLDIIGMFITVMLIAVAVR